MVVRMRHNRSQTKSRRSHHAIKVAGMVACDNCGDRKLKHAACKTCGKYKSREVFDIIGKTAKKAAKRKEKEKAQK
jgi:large subunit ribosomal protein L32